MEPLEVVVIPFPESGRSLNAFAVPSMRLPGFPTPRAEGENCQGHVETIRFADG